MVNQVKILEYIHTHNITNLDKTIVLKCHIIILIFKIIN